MRTAVLAYDGCLASGVSGFVDTLAVADHLQGGPLGTVRVLSDGGGPVRCFAGAILPVDGALDGPGAPDAGWDVVYVPPAFGVEEPPPGAAAWVKAAHAAGAVACAACAGVFVLAEAGMLEGRAATTHWGLAGAFAARYPGVALEPDRMLVDGGDYVCAGGVTAYFDLALHLVARFASPDTAAACARTLLLDPGRERQTPYMSLLAPAGHADPAMRRALAWLEDNHARPVRITELAAAVHLSARTLERRFKAATKRTPRQYVQAVRVEHAKRLLESGGEPVGVIAGMVGYADATAFCSVFKTLTGLPPGEYRRRFRCGGRREGV
ncbi:MAG: GlxA family transcriptional regulator [Desulfovibrionaceae bacterium]